ncbi:MAG: hypothetical protein P1U36_07035 [Legionellaceae bacterium]|nr:hypothetical protein [Legionellaceae bacterium]
MRKFRGFEPIERSSLKKNQQTFSGSNYPLKLFPIGEGSCAEIYRSGSEAFMSKNRENVDVYMLTEAVGDHSVLAYKVVELPVNNGLESLENFRQEVRALIDNLEREIRLLKQALALSEDEVKVYQAKNVEGFVNDDGEIELLYSPSPDAIAYYLFSMPFYQGVELFQQFKSSHVLPFNFIISLMRKIISVVEVIQERGVFHCDLNPANIILTEAYFPDEPTSEKLDAYLSQVTVKIIDFGYARDNVADNSVLLSDFNTHDAEHWINGMIRAADTAIVNNHSVVHALLQHQKFKREDAYDRVMAPWMDSVGLARCMAFLLDVVDPQSVFAGQITLINTMFTQLICPRSRRSLDSKDSKDSNQASGITKLKCMLEQLESPQSVSCAHASLFNASVVIKQTAQQQSHVPTL